MARTVHLKLLTAALGAALAPAAAAQGVAAPTNSPNSPILAPGAGQQETKSPAPKRPRAISPAVSAALSAVAPKYTPPAPKPAPRPESEQIDMREVDRPKNKIIRLPDYVVREKKPAVFSERAITTDKGLADIAVRRYISDMDRALNRFTLPLFGTSTEARALAMYAEDERLKNMADLHGAAVDAAKSDPAAGAYILRETRDTYMRTSDFGWNGGDPK